MTAALAQGAPERSLAQRLDALDRANRVRTFRAELKREVKAGTVSAVPALAEPPAQLATMKVIDLLLAVPKVGRVKAGRWLTRCRVAPSKTVGGLSERQRGELLGMLEPWLRGVR